MQMILDAFQNKIYTVDTFSGESKYLLKLHIKYFIFYTEQLGPRLNVHWSDWDSHRMSDNSCTISHPVFSTPIIVSTNTFPIILWKVELLWVIKEAPNTELSGHGLQLCRTLLDGILSPSQQTTSILMTESFSSEHSTMIPSPKATDRSLRMNGQVTSYQCFYKEVSKFMG